MQRVASPDDFLKPVKDILQEYRLACADYREGKFGAEERVRYWRDVIVAHTLIYNQHPIQSYRGITIS